MEFGPWGLDVNLWAGFWVSRFDLRPVAYILTWSAGPKGPDDLCLTLGFEPLDWDLGFKAGIWASRLGFGPGGGGLSFELGVWASRMGFGLQGWGLGFEVGV